MGHISDYQSIARYIRENYKGKIVEVGIGGHPEVALLLNEDFDVTVTDSRDLQLEGVRFIKDDIFNPDIEVYKDASLIYSIRPPPDMQGAIASVAEKVGANLLIRPFSVEQPAVGERFTCVLVNYEGAAFYAYKPNASPP